MAALVLALSSPLALALGAPAETVLAQDTGSSPQEVEPMAPPGEFPNCSWNCTAKDVRITDVWLGDETGEPCTPGATEDLTVWVRLQNNTGTERYYVSVITDVEVYYSDGTLFPMDPNPVSVSPCVYSPILPDEDAVGPVAVVEGAGVTCDLTVYLRNTIVAWNTTPDKAGDTCEFAPTACNAWPPSKCSYEEDYVTAVTVSSFEVLREGDALYFAWRTESELNNVGFDLFAAEAPDDAKTQINTEFIPAEGFGLEPQDYTYEIEVPGLAAGSVFYLRALEVGGRYDWIGPVWPTIVGADAAPEPPAVGDAPKTAPVLSPYTGPVRSLEPVTPKDPIVGPSDPAEPIEEPTPPHIGPVPAEPQLVIGPAPSALTAIRR
jgi:hypothetical protein